MIADRLSKDFFDMGMARDKVVVQIVEDATADPNPNS